jgi:hypothetical protein
MAMAAKIGSAAAAAATVAMAVTDNNRNCRGRQQSTKCGSNCGGDSGRGRGDHGSTALMAGSASEAAEVTTMRAAATATTVVVNIPP